MSMTKVHIPATLNNRVIITKLDGRYVGGALFKYCLEFHYPYIDGDFFCAVREWCWSTWGPGRELKFIPHTNNSFKWAFLIDTNRTRIYLLGDEELSWYKIRWE